MSQRRQSRNPWVDQHLAGEMEYTGDGYTRRQAAALVRGEYAGHDPVPCGACDAQAHYRATIGAYQCSHCRAVRYSVWVHKETGAERRGSSIPGSIANQYRVEWRWD